jgi:uncharacterized protein YeaO (DUF488 family)
MLLIQASMIHLKRAYEPFQVSDGYRVLVERRWPRGLRKVDAHVERFSEFRERYKRELRTDPARTAVSANRAARETVTLVYSAHDEVHNNAVRVMHST